MLYIPKIGDYLKILNDDEVKYFVAIHFSEYFKSAREKLYFKLSERQNLSKVAELLYIFLTTPEEVDKYAKIMQARFSVKYVHRYSIKILNLFDPEVQLINTKTMIKNKLKELLSELKKFEVQTILVLEYKKRNDGNTFHSSTKVITSDTDISSV